MIKNYFNTNSFANRGMVLEDDINETNKYYLIHNIAVIYKKPTPIKVVRVEYPKNVIREAYFSEPSTLDYNGIYNGNYIEFDAKETRSKSSFPISNIHKHQVDHIRKILEFGGVVFLVVRFSLLNETYILMGRDLINFIDSNKRKSIPYDFFKNNGYFIDLKYRPRLDYIKVINRIIKVKDVGENEKKEASY